MRVVIFIPTYNPSELLIKTLSDIQEHSNELNLEKIIINDGSTKNLEMFNKAMEFPNVTIISHQVNKGKGAAIKTGLNYILNRQEGIDYVVTVDSDFQHRGNDIVSIIEFLNKNDRHVCIGVRSMDREKMPMRSYFGNVSTKIIFKILYNYDLLDTQSGLRAYPKESFRILTDLRSNRYEFEMEAIILLIKNKFTLSQIPISTIYFNGNSSSHFRPIVDSIKIYYILFSWVIIFPFLLFLITLFTLKKIFL